MHLLQFTSPELASRAAAQAVVELVRSTPAARMGLPTGRTPLPLYGTWAAMQAAEEVDFSNVAIFALDEYVGLQRDHPNSFAHFLQKNVQQPLGIPSHHLFAIDGQAKDPEDACLQHEVEITAGGGLDLAILGIGENGHIAFNEPGSLPSSRTRKIQLEPRTIHSNAASFGGDVKAVPQQALTMGIATLLEARQILVLAFGPHKANATAAAMQGPVHSQVPASFLQQHSNVTWYVDEAAAAKLD